jgi:hypothetical protein
LELYNTKCTQRLEHTNHVTCRKKELIQQSVKYLYVFPMWKTDK